MREAIRVLSSGAVAGLVLYLVKAIMLALVARDALAALNDEAVHSRMPGHYFLIVDLCMGVWVVWFYSAISERYGSGFRSVAMAGGSLWLMKTLQSAHWIGLGFMTWGVMLGAAVSSLLGAIAAAMAGASIYRRVRLTSRRDDPRPG